MAISDLTRLHDGRPGLRSLVQLKCAMRLALSLRRWIS